ncbi:Phosphate starvation-inducible protein PhoH, predicted ATPase [hydrothermal vent metagenome]|uniref:PhoH-like protein n=1 Tax=hydrothermal vent metagenome TaxID=652676 RepID=A0A3B0TQ33_9ZZZZ
MTTKLQNRGLSIERQSDGRVVLSFDDNRLLAEVCGEHDRHLAQIEDGLGIQAAPHGNHIVLTGSPGDVSLAKSVLTGLYQRVAKGQSIGPNEVDGAMRLVEDAPHIVAGEAGGNEIVRTRRRTVRPRSPRQAQYLKAMAEKPLVFGVGPAGTGKTYLAVAVAASWLERGLVDRIILSRPAVEAGERLGFLPGDMREKVDPYLRPLYDALYDCLPEAHVARGLETGQIEIAPLAFMRGRTLANAFVILDEAQNCTQMQMKMFLTRLGENSRMAVTGDPSQVDLPTGVPSGLHQALSLLKGVADVDIIRFGSGDVVRHPLVARIVDAYEANAKTSDAD